MAFFLTRSLPLLLLGAALAGCSHPDAADAPATAAAGSATASSLAVTLARAQARPIERAVIASGPVSAWASN